MNRQFGLPTFNFHHSAHKLTVAIIAVSVVFGLLGQRGAIFLLNPGAVFEGFQIWRPFTYAFVATNPMEVIFGALIIYGIGGELESYFGRRRFIGVALGIPFIAAILTLCIALIFPASFMLAYYAGATCVITTVWIVFGLRAWKSRQMLNFWGIPLSGKNFALMGLGFVVLQGVFSSFLLVIPELIAAGLSYAYVLQPKLFEPFRKIELAYYNWKLKRLKARKEGKSRHGLRVVKGSSSAPSDDDYDPKIH